MQCLRLPNTKLPLFSCPPQTWCHAWPWQPGSPPESPALARPPSTAVRGAGICLISILYTGQHMNNNSSVDTMVLILGQSPYKEQNEKDGPYFWPGLSLRKDSYYFRQVLSSS